MLVLWSSEWFGSLTFSTSLSIRVCRFVLEVELEDLDVCDACEGSRCVRSLRRLDRVSSVDDEGDGGAWEGSEADILSPSQDIGFHM